MDRKRYLVVIADDYGIGSATSQGILYLAAHGVVTGAVLLVNSPFAESAVQAWRRDGKPMELGWHPCLTLDRPVLQPYQTPSLVQPDGTFWPLGSFVRRLYGGKIHPSEIQAELTAQYVRFQDLVGHAPTLVNSHHHVQIFSPVGAILGDILRHQRPLPYVRRVREPWSMLATVPGARYKRLFLSTLGRRDARRQERLGFTSGDWLAGVTDPPWVADPCFFSRWLTRIPGQVVELTCHPGFLDTTLIGRDCTDDDGQLLRRVRELNLLRQESFDEACRQAGFTRIAPAQLRTVPSERNAHAG